MLNTEIVPKLDVSHITRVFPNGNCALNDVTFSVAEGEFIVVGGSNGSGKSVLMTIIAGLDEPTSGTIKITGNEFIGLIFQDADSQIMGETPEEDVSFGLRNIGTEKKQIKGLALKALAEVGLEDKFSDPARFMSGGEKRRLSVAGVLAMNCDVFIFDEPFANLDWPGVRQVCNIMKELKQDKKTVIVLTHELEKILGLSDRLIILNKGEIQFNGNAEDALKKDMSVWGIRNPISQYNGMADLFWGDTMQVNKSNCL